MLCSAPHLQANTKYVLLKAVSYCKYKTHSQTDNESSKQIPMFLLLKVSPIIIHSMYGMSWDTLYGFKLLVCFIVKPILLNFITHKTILLSELHQLSIYSKLSLSIKQPQSVILLVFIQLMLECKLVPYLARTQPERVVIIRGVW